MSLYIVDVEADGPCPGLYSMTEIGIVQFDMDGKFENTFHGRLKPISEDYVQRALDVCKHTREQTLTFDDPKEVMERMAKWVETTNRRGRPLFFSDNNGFDWQFVNYYCHKFLGENPFGFSSRNIGDLYKGMEMNLRVNFKHLRKTKHTHHPVDDAKGNAEALHHMVRKMGLRV